MIILDVTTTMTPGLIIIIIESLRDNGLVNFHHTIGDRIQSTAYAPAKATILIPCKFEKKFLAGSCGDAGKASYVCRNTPKNVEQTLRADRIYMTYSINIITYHSGPRVKGWPRR